MHPLSKRLLSLGDEYQFHASPLRPSHVERRVPGLLRALRLDERLAEQLAELDELEQAIGQRFPDDYRAVMLEVGSFSVRGPQIWLMLELVSDLLLMTDDHDDYMPGILMIGGDGGDYGYYYDLKGRLGRDAFAIYFVELGTLTFEGSHFVAPTLSEAVEQVLAGENFRDHPCVGK